MAPVIIGIVLGILIILLIRLVRLFDENIMYGLILSAIGFLYVGFSWSDMSSLIVTAVQAVFFLVMAYYGIKNISILAAGYFMHGLWDMVYGIVQCSDLVPPHYDWFCLSIDFTMGIYLVFLKTRRARNKI